jgi:hypothetical protein
VASRSTAATTAGLDVVLRPGPVPVGDADMLAGAMGTVRVLRRRSAAVRVLARVDDVPGFGWRQVDTGAVPPSRRRITRLTNGW